MRVMVNNKVMCLKENELLIVKDAIGYVIGELGQVGKDCDSASFWFSKLSGGYQVVFCFFKECKRKDWGTGFLYWKEIRDNPCLLGFIEMFYGVGVALVEVGFSDNGDSWYSMKINDCKDSL